MLLQFYYYGQSLTHNIGWYLYSTDNKFWLVYYNFLFLLLYSYYPSNTVSCSSHIDAYFFGFLPFGYLYPFHSLLIHCIDFVYFEHNWRIHWIFYDTLKYYLWKTRFWGWILQCIFSVFWDQAILLRGMWNKQIQYSTVVYSTVAIQAAKWYQSIDQGINK